MGYTGFYRDNGKDNGNFSLGFRKGRYSISRSLHLLKENHLGNLYCSVTVCLIVTKNCC